MNSKQKSILDRIKHLEDAIVKGQEYLEKRKTCRLAWFSPFIYS